MIFDSSTFTFDMLSNPAKLGKATIDALEASDTTGTLQINDPNNGFVMTMMANNAIFSKFSEKVDYINSYFYPQRARNAKQLYPHLSEYDYVKLQASPATLPFVFAMDKDWISSHSVYYDSNYNKIEIPATSFLTMGGIVYSMYYPIEILVNRNTGAVTAFYDTSVSNDLNTLESNMLLNVQQYTQYGINYFQITFNMYQFERTVSTYTVSAAQGFIKSLPYLDQFYAIKVYTLSTAGLWTELAYSLDTMYYDYTNPTALLNIQNDTSKVQVTIPQIYFDNGQISQSIKLELYTTKGAVNYALGSSDVLGIKANFDTSSSSFASPLAQMPTYDIYPTVVDVAGGSNPMSYAQLRYAVVNQQLSDRVAVTTPEVLEAGQKAGFNLRRVVDDLTERMYTASNVLTDSNKIVIPTFAGSILLADASLTGDPSTIINYTDGYYTLLPTTTFTIVNDSLTCVPLTNGQVATLSALTPAELVTELNKGTYVRQPFHITLQTEQKSPQACVYNLLSPVLTSLSFIAENAHSAPQMAATSCQVNHLNNGTGGYQILLGITRSSNLRTAAASNFNIYLICSTKTGSKAYLPATYVSTDTDGVDTWQIRMSTSYHITTDGFLAVTMYDTNDTLQTVEVALTQSFTLATSFLISFDTTIPTAATLNLLLPPSQQGLQVVMAQQTIVLQLGEDLSEKIYCGVDTTWGNDVYETIGETTYFTTHVPIFQTTETGVVNTRIDPSDATKIDLVTLYTEGSTPSATGDIILITAEDTPVSTGGATTTAFLVEDATGLLVGMSARGTNIPVNSDVTAVNLQTNIVTLSTAITTLIPKGTQIVITNPHLLVRTSAAQTAVGPQLTVGSTAGMIAGQSVFGFDIPADNTIYSVDSATQFTLKTAPTIVIGDNVLLTIVNTTAHGVVKNEVGDIVSDAAGNPVVVKDAQNQYRIPTILFDGRLYASQDPNDQTIITSISQYLQNYANQIATLDAGLLEESQVYYKPARSMGAAVFGIGNSQTITMSLELSFSITVYVDTAVFNTAALLTTMTDSIYSIVNAAIQLPTISCSNIATTINDQLGTNVSDVEVSDISGKVGLRYIALQDPDVTPSIENLLTLNSDNTISRKPSIAITFSPKPDTSQTLASTASA